jgi:hypothetical protein
MSCPSPVRTLPQISFGSARNLIALDLIREMPPWSLDAAIKIKSDTVQSDRWPSFITNRLARHYRGFKPQKYFPDNHRYHNRSPMK